MPACYQKGKERGIWYEIKRMELLIKIKEAKAEDTAFEKGLLEAYRKYTEADYLPRLTDSI